MTIVEKVSTTISGTAARTQTKANINEVVVEPWVCFVPDFEHPPENVTVAQGLQENASCYSTIRLQSAKTPRLT